jgi:hypothetical protein
MFALFFLAGMCVVVSMIAAVWLLVVAFKKSTLWGLAVMFVPFANIVFVVKNWEDSKKPFLINLGALTAAFMLFFVAGGAAMMNMASLAQQEMAMATDPSYTFDGTTDSTMVDTGSDLAYPDNPAIVEVPESDAPDARDSGTVAYLEPSSPSMESVLAAVAAPLPKPRRLRFGNIPVDQVDESYVGELLRVVSRDGMNTLAVVTAVSPSSIAFEREVFGGTFEFDLTHNEIESLEAIRR